MARYFNYSMSLLSHSICLALERNAIDLNPEFKDAWGLPAVRVTFEQHPDDLKTLRFLLDRQMEILVAADATRKWAFPIGETTFSAHLVGTCRMGNDSRTSPTMSPTCSIVDGSSLVTCGRQQPTATIQALAYWAAEHMVRRANAGEI